MPKLQRIKRTNGSLVYSVNIPLEIIQELGWEKGAILSLEIKKIGDKHIITVLKNEQEEETNDAKI